MTYTSAIQVTCNKDGSVEIRIDGRRRGRYDNTHDVASYLGLAFTRIDDLEEALREIRNISLTMVDSRSKRPIDSTTKG